MTCRRVLASPISSAFSIRFITISFRQLSCSDTSCLHDNEWGVEPRLATCFHHLITLSISEFGEYTAPSAKPYHLLIWRASVRLIPVFPSLFTDTLPARPNRSNELNDLLLSRRATQVLLPKNNLLSSTDPSSPSFRMLRTKIRRR